MAVRRGKFKFKDSKSAIIQNHAHVIFGTAKMKSIDSKGFYFQNS